MPYSDINDQKKVMPEETIKQYVDDERTESLSNPTVLARYNEIRDASDSEIDPYLEAAGYEVPLTTVPAMIRGASCIITRYRMGLRKDSVSETIRAAYKDTIKLLESIRDGKMKLPSVSQADTASETGLGIGVITNTRFTT